MKKDDRNDGARYRVLFENSADAKLIISGDKFVDCNTAAVKMLRCEDKNAVLQTHPSDLSPEFQPDGRRSFEKANEMMSIALQQGSHRFEWEHIRLDGEVFPVEVLLTAIPSSNPQSDKPDLHTVWRDISESKRVEDELRHAQKMEAIGKLSGGIAHDFNNHLVPILGYSELLAGALVDNPELLKLVDAIELSGIRAAELVKRLMVFSYKDSRHTQVIDLGEAISKLLGMIDQLIGEDVEFEFSGYEQSLPVKMDQGDIEQIVLNLTTNARDALPRGGKVSLALSLKKNSDGDFARLEVIDNGVGMDAATLSQIFEPFFTTKGIGSGTGLGLSTVYSLVSQAKGKIRAQSNQDEGTRFELLFPLSELTAGEPKITGRAAATEPRQNIERLNGSRILIVEDDDEVAGLLRKVLTRAGYEITEARDGLVALDIFKNRDFDLVLTDVIMPELSGPLMVKEMARIMKSKGFKVPVLFMSGYTDDRLAPHGFDASETPLLRKPFTPTNVLEAVRQLLKR